MQGRCLCVQGTAVVIGGSGFAAAGRCGSSPGVQGDTGVMRDVIYNVLVFCTKLLCDGT